MRLQQKVFMLLRKIPRGKVTTYKAIAKQAGAPKAYRAVGNILHGNKRLIAIPCHRVIRTSGKVGGYVLGARQKTALLKQEGVVFLAGARVAKKFIIM